MKRWLIVFAALLPLSSIANMLNNNEPNRPGYNPSQQRMQTQMQTRQQLQKQQLQQDQQLERQNTQRKMQEQRNSAQQRVIQSQTGQPGIVSPTQQNP